MAVETPLHSSHTNTLPGGRSLNLGHCRASFSAYGRRNISDMTRSRLAAENKAELLEQGRVKYAETVGRPKKSVSTVDINCATEKHSTRTELAKQAGGEGAGQTH